MNITITHTIDISENTQKFITALVTALHGGTIKAPVAETTGTATKRTGKAKEAPAAADNNEGTTAPATDESAADGIITFAMLQGRFAEKKAEGKNELLKQLLKDNNVAALSGLKEAQYKFFYDEAGKL